MVAQFTTIGHSNRSLDDFTRMLREAGVEDFEAYAVQPGATLQPDLFL